MEIGGLLWLEPSFLPGFFRLPPRSGWTARRGGAAHLIQPKKKKKKKKKKNKKKKTKNDRRLCPFFPPGYYLETRGLCGVLGPKINHWPSIWGDLF